MSLVPARNKWGTEGSNLDQQRADLFRLSINIPNGGTGVWGESVEFAVKAFPFPDRAVDTFQTKYLQQTNHQIGGDKATAEVSIPVRYAFAKASAQALYTWFNLISNARTGGVGLTSQVKRSGKFQWLIPDMAVQTANASNFTGGSENVLATALEYTLEGCLITGLKPSDGKMETGNEGVDLTFNLIVDRYYPTAPTSLIVVPTRA